MKARLYCEKCIIRNRALCSALSSTGVAELSRIAHFRRIPAGQVIHSGHRDLSWFAVIISGVVKLVKAQPDGRHQIVGLQFPADFLGRPYGTNSPLIAQATTNLELCCFSKSAFENLMQEHPPLEHVLLLRALDELQAAREWMFVLGRRTAQEQVASLLLLIAWRMVPSGCEGECGQTSLQFDLPLSRTEIGDCLGLTIETVSREIRYLRSKGVIGTKGRRTVIVPDRGALKRLAEGEQE